MSLPLPLRPVPERALFDALNRAQAVSDAEVRRILLAALAELRAGADPRIMARAIEDGNGAIAVNAFPWQRFAARLDELRAALGPATTRGTLLGLSMLPAQGTPIDRRDLREATAAWIAEHTGALISKVTETTRQGIRALVGEAFGEKAFGGDVALRKRIANLLRARQLNGLVGLTTPQASALAKYGQELIAKQPDISSALFDHRMKQRFERLLAVRAKTIARTEASYAANGGQLVAWREAVAAGALDPARYEREWVTRVGRACPECARFDGARAPLGGGVFRSTAGEVSAHPPLHPRCQCVMRLKRIRRPSAPAPVLTPPAPLPVPRDPVEALRELGFTIAAAEEQAVAAGWRRVVGSIEPEEFFRRQFSGTPLADLAGASYRTVHAAGGGFDFSIQWPGVGEISRALVPIEGRGFRAEHDVFLLARDLRGRGIGSIVVGQQVALWEQLGATRVDLVASMDAGGYTWARFGFLPTRAGWQELRLSVARRLATLRQAGRIAEDAYRRAAGALASPDPRAIWRIAGMADQVTDGNTLGRDLLAGLNWQGSLDLNNADQMQRFLAYVGRPR